MKEWILICFFSGMGFTLAHVLHFYQVISFFGSTQKAINEFYEAASTRSINVGKKMVIKEGIDNLHIFSNLKEYLWRVAGRGRYLAINLINFVWIIVALGFIKEFTIRIKNLKFESNVSRRDILALLSAILISGMWGMIMKQHAFIHGFIARHFYLVFFMCCLILFRRVKLRKEDGI